MILARSVVRVNSQQKSHTVSQVAEGKNGLCIRTSAQKVLSGWNRIGGGGGVPQEQRQWLQAASSTTAVVHLPPSNRQSNMLYSALLDICSTSFIKFVLIPLPLPPMPPPKQTNTGIYRTQILAQIDLRLIIGSRFYFQTASVEIILKQQINS